MSTVAWAGWVALVMAVALTTTNPSSLAILLSATVLVAIAAPKTERAGLGIRYLALLGIGLFALSIGVAVINTGSGDHTLFTLPRLDAPEQIGGLSVGGAVTAEALVGGAIRGAVIFAVLLGFAVFSGAVSPHAALRLAPAVLFHSGLAVTIGLALLPATLTDIQRLREMQALRGRRGGVRELHALVVPAVMGGLDRAMRFAEAMEARGYAAPPAIPAGTRLAGLAAAPLLVAATWVWFYYPEARWAGAAAAAAGAIAIVFWGWDIARRHKTTRLTVEHEPPALFVAGRVSLALAAGVVVAALAGWAPAGYNPFAGLAVPEFSAAGAAPAFAAAWPLPFLAFSETRPRAEASSSVPSLP